MLVIGVEKQSPAERSGVAEGDVIIGLDDTSVRSVDDLRKFLNESRIGAACRLIPALVSTARRQIACSMTGSVPPFAQLPQTRRSAVALLRGIC